MQEYAMKILTLVLASLSLSHLTFASDNGGKPLRPQTPQSHSYQGDITAAVSSVDITANQRVEETSTRDQLLKIPSCSGMYVVNG